MKQKDARKLLRKHGCTLHEIKKYIPYLVAKRLMGEDAVNYYPRTQGDLVKLIPGHETIKARGVRFDIACLPDRRQYEDIMASLLIRREATRESFSAKKKAKHRSYSALLAKALHRATSDVSEKRRLKLEAYAQVRSNMKHGSSQAPIIEIELPLAKLGETLPGLSIPTLSRLRQRATKAGGMTLRENFTGCPFPEKEIELEIERRSGFVRSKYYKGQGVPEGFRRIAPEYLELNGNMLPWFIAQIDRSIPILIEQGILPAGYPIDEPKLPERPWHKMRVIGGVPLMQEASSVICAPLKAKCMQIKGTSKRRVRTPESAAEYKAAKLNSHLFNGDIAQELKGAFADHASMERALAAQGLGRRSRKQRMAEYRKVYKSIIFC